MDIKRLKTVSGSEAGAECQLVDPRTYEYVDAWISLKGPDSQEWRKQKRIIEKKLIDSRAQGIELEDIDYMDIDARALAAIATGWRGIQEDGKDVEFSHEAVLDLLINSPVIVQRLLSFLDNRENFIKD